MTIQVKEALPRPSRNDLDQEDVEPLFEEDFVDDDNDGSDEMAHHRGTIVCVKCGLRWEWPGNLFDIGYGCSLRNGESRDSAAWPRLARFV